MNTVDLHKLTKRRVWFLLGPVGSGAIATASPGLRTSTGVKELAITLVKNFGPLPHFGK